MQTKQILATLIILISTTQVTVAQSEWALHISAEETVTLGDQRSSFNFLSFTQLAANSGMRAGFHYTKDNTLAAEVTLGVVGSSRPNTWFTKLVPVEVVGHYNVVPLLLDDSPLKFNVDLGIGSWIPLNIASMVLYGMKGLPVYAGLMGIYSILSVVGFIRWRK